jgi:hypothetical protein
MTSGTQGRDWERHQWEGEGQDDLPDDRERKDPVPHWNKYEWEGEGQDDSPHEDRPAEPMGEGDHEFSGHGENPGGGQRWARVDRDEDELDD